MSKKSRKRSNSKNIEVQNSEDKNVFNIMTKSNGLVGKPFHHSTRYSSNNAKIVPYANDVKDKVNKSQKELKRDMKRDVTGLNLHEHD